MDINKIETVILVDDRASDYADGGRGSIQRKDRYNVLFRVLKQHMNKLQHIYLILGDGIFVFDQDLSLDPLESKSFKFPDGNDGTVIADKIKKFSNGVTIIIMDYYLNNSNNKKSIGEELQKNILREIMNIENSTKLLFSNLMPEVSDEKKETYGFDILSNFPINNPTDAAETLQKYLEKR